MYVVIFFFSNICLNIYNPYNRIYVFTTPVFAFQSYFQAIEGNGKYDTY